MAKFLTLSHLKIFFKSLKEKLSPVAFSGSYNDLNDVPEIPTTEISTVGKTGEYKDLKNKPNLAQVATSGNYWDLESRPNLKTVATSGNYNDLTNKPNLKTVATSGNYNDLTNTPALANVATTGSYNDLTNKPTIPQAGASRVKVGAQNNSTTSSLATTEGYFNWASSYAHAEGKYTRALGEQSHAEGQASILTVGLKYVSVLPEMSYGYRFEVASYNKDIIKVNDYIFDNQIHGSSSKGIGRVLSISDSSGTQFVHILFDRSLLEGRKKDTSYVSYAIASPRELGAYGNNSHIEGRDTAAIADQAHAEGYGTIAAGSCSHTEGDNQTSSSYFTAEYDKNNDFIVLTNPSHRGASQVYTDFRIGQIVFTTKDNIDYQGYIYAYNSTDNIISIEFKTNIPNLAQNDSFTFVLYEGGALGTASHTEGYETTASGYASHAEGSHTLASKSSTHAEGYSTQAQGDYSHTEGNLTCTRGNNSHAEGYKSLTFGTSSHAEGQGSNTFTFVAKYSENDDFIITTQPGQGKEIIPYQIVSITKNSTTYYGYIYAIDNDTISVEFQSAISGLQEDDSFTFTVYESGAYGKYSHTENNQTIAIGEGAHAEGNVSKAVGDYSHAEGQKTKATGAYSHTEGESTTASGTHSHAEGASTTASGKYSHAEGYTVKATGYAAHAEGLSTQSTGYYTHAEGENTIANHRAQHVFGTYNIADDSAADPLEKGNYIEIVGNGERNALSNARTLDWNGNEVLAGGLKVSSAGITIGNTTITETQLQNLLGLLNS